MFMKRNGLLSGALILSVGGVLAKIFSAIYRIAITRILGGVGIGIYQLIFPLYSLCVVIATAGLPMAISKVIARNKGNEKNILKKCFLFSSIVSLVLTFVLLVFSKPLAVLQGEERISICYIILAPAIILVSFSSVLRGYFQGKHNFVPSAISNIFEQFVKLCSGLVLCVVLLKISLLASIIGAIISIVISEVVSLVILLIYFKKNAPKNHEVTNVEFKSLFKDILPITITNLILPIATFIDSLLVVNLLKINFTKSMSIFLYGIESGAVSSLVSLPTIFSFAIASVILPNITKSKSEFNKKNSLALSIKIILIICVPCVLGFMLVPNRLMELLYSNRLNGLGVGGNNLAFRLLTISGFGVVFLALNQLYSSTLQAIDKRNITVRNLLIGVGVKLAIELIFMPSKVINIYALSVANTACYLTVMILNHIEIGSSFNLKFNYIFAGKLMLSNALMLTALLSVMMFGGSSVNTLTALLVAGSVYLLSLFKLKILNKKECAFLKYKVS